MTRRKKRIRLAAAALFLVVLAVIYAAVRKADFNAEDSLEEETEQTVLTVERENIRTAVIENSQGVMRFTYDGETWENEEDPDMELNQDSVNALFNRLNPLNAVRDLGTQEKLEDYGLAEPDVVITVTVEDGQEFTISLGKEASDGNLYFMTSESDHVYTGDSYLTTAFGCTMSELEAEETDEE